MLNTIHILELLKKNARKELLTEEEEEDLALALRIYPEEMLDALIEKLEQEIGAHASGLSNDRWLLIASIPSSGKQTKTAASNKELRWMLPAAVVFIGVLVFLFRQQLINPSGRIISHCDSIQVYKNGIPPGADKASLTLFNGDQVLLDSAFQQLTTLQGGTVLKRLTTGEFKYTNQPGRKSDSSLYNTINTSRGTQCILILPDGTTARLNALSSLRFPLYFAGFSREVTITGEVYFDVAKSAGKPFYVLVNNTRLKVTGTRFNVNAYDKAISTTLISGRLTIQNAGSSIPLKSGEQATILKNTTRGKAVSISRADISHATSWKDGYLIFKQEPAREAMKEIARWYDLELVNVDEIPYSMNLTGVICRGMSFNELTGLLKAKGFQFQAEERKLVFIR